MRKNIDMLNGPLFRNIILYSLPVVATGVLQLLFNATDLIVVGQFCGSKYIGAVGATGNLVNLIVNLFIGFSVGAGVIVAQNVGRKDNTAVSETVHTSIILAFLSGILLTVVGVLVSAPALKIMGTPKSVLEYSTLYLKIYFLGSVPNLIYNFGASVLRAVGDTKSPLIYLTISGLANIGLNIFFVTAFDMTVDGVAIATVASQVISAILVIRALMKRDDACKLSIKKLKITAKRAVDVLKIGIPTGLQGSIFSFSNVIIQSSINSFGAVALAGHSAASSIDGFILTAVNSFDQPAMNFTAQNYGAGNVKKSRKILLLCWLSVALVGITMGMIILAFARPLLGIYIKDSVEAVNYGVLRLSIMAPLYFICGLLNATSGIIRGFGQSLIPTINCVFGACLLRIIFIFTLFKLPQFHSLASLYISYPVTWVITMALQLVTFYFVYKNRKKELQN